MTLESSTSPVIFAAAHAVVEAEDAISGTTPVVHAAHAARKLLADRLAALDAKSGEIAKRRAGGEIRPDDAGEVALIAMDREGVETLLFEADRALESAERDQREAAARLQEARRHLAVAEAEARATALAAHAQKLIALLTEAFDAHASELLNVPARDRVELLRAYVENMGGLDSALLVVLKRAGEASNGVVGYSVRWQPSAALRAALSRQELTGGILQIA